MFASAFAIWLRRTGREASQVGRPRPWGEARQ